MTKYIIAIVFTILFSAAKVHSQINPDDIDGLELWLKSSDNLVLNSGKVVSWGDLSVNGLSLSQGTDANRGMVLSSVNLINSFPSVKLDGINDFYTLSSSLDNVRTVFIIAKHQTGSSTEFEPILGHSTFFDFHGVNGTKLFRPQSVSSGLINGTCRVNQTTLPAVQIDKPQDYSILSFVSNTNLHFNQLSKDRTQNRFWNGEFVEIIMYSGALTSGEVEGIEAYLRERYAPPVNLGEDILRTDFCPFDLSVPNRFKSVLWNTGSTDFDITVTEPGLYWVEAEDVFGGISYDTIHVSFPGNQIDDFDLCTGQDSIWNSELAGFSLEWQDGSTNPTYTISGSGTYSFTATDGSGCTYSSSEVIVIEDNFSNSLTIDVPSPFCLGNSVALAGDLENLSFIEWSTAETNIEIIPLNEGEVSVLAINNNGCVANDTVTLVSVGSAPDVDFSYDLDCENFGANFQDESSTVDGSVIDLWSWSIDGDIFGDNSSSASIQNQTGSKSINLDVSTSSGCTGSFEREIVFPGMVEINITESNYCAETAYNFELNIDLPFDIVSSHSWSIYNLDGSLNSSSNSFTITTQFDTSGDYLVEAEVTGVSGCIRIASTYLQIKDQSFCFNPADNSNLELWLASDQNITQNNGIVSSWDDPRNNGISATSPTIDQSPSYIPSVPELNSLPALRFDGVNDFMDFGEITDIRNVFVVFKHQSGYQAIQAPIFGHPTIFDFHGNAIDSLLFSSTNTSVNIRNGEARFNGVYTNPIELLKPKEYGILSLNPLDEIRAQYITNDRNGVGRVWRGDYVEILFYNDSLSDEKIVEVEQYLRYKYAPPIDLPREIRVEYGFCDTALIGYKPWFTSYAWSTGSTDSIIHTQKSGIYSLTVTDIFGYQSTDSVNVIFDGVFRESDTILCDGDILTYDTGLNQSDYTIEWNTTETSPAINISTEGEFFVNVSDTLGCVFYSDTIFVELDSFPTLMELVEIPTFCLGNELFLASGFAEAEAYNWNTGEDTPFIQPTSSGEYWVEATNANGCVGRDTVVIDIAGAAPFVEFTAGTACVGNAVVFTDETFPEGSTITGQDWVFEFPQTPADTLQGAVVDQVFAEAGEYPVELTVTLATGCTGTGRDTVTVNPLPLVSFNFDEVVPCAGNEVAFESESGVPGDGEIASYAWTFGNGTSDVGIVGTTTFANLGVNTVQLAVTTTDGCVDSLLSNVVVLGSPVVDFTFDTVCVGMPTVFNEAVDVTESGPVFYNWQFGDGFFSNFPNTSHVFGAPGVYNVQLTATGNDFGGAGCVDQLTRQVRVYAAPEGNIETTDACLGEGVVFTDLTEAAVQGGVGDGIDTRAWVLPFGYGQGPVAVGGDSVQVWSALESGSYAVEMSFVTEAGCTGMATANVDVLAVPEASFSLEVPEVAPPFGVSTTNTSVDAQGYVWMIDGDVVSTAAEPELLIPDTGVYVVSLVATSGLGCNDTTSLEVQAINPRYDLALVDIRYVISGGRLTLRAVLGNNGNVPIREFELAVSLGLSAEVEAVMEFDLGAGEVREFTLPETFGYLSARDLPYVCMEVGLERFGIAEFDLENNGFCIGLEKEKAVFIDPYPNPAFDIVKVGYILPRAGTVELQVMDSEGRELRSVSWDSEAGYTLNEVNVGDLSEGSYFLRYSYLGEEVVRRVVVVE